MKADSTDLPEHRAEGAEAPPRVSVVVPLHNEEASLRELHRLIAEVMGARGEPWELVLVDDGSDDATARILEELCSKEPRVVGVHLRRNYGQTPALMAGFDHARGEVIVSMDGDLQHDPTEIPHFLDKLEEGYDLVSGWRVSRSDELLTRKLPSRIANWLMARVSRVALHDFGTTFKAYRREILEDVHLYGDLHRFVPALIAHHGASIAEIPIRDLGRSHGRSHYGLSRTFRVLLDLLTVGFLLRYLTRPLHFFGKISGVCLAVSGATGAFLLLRKLLAGISLFDQHGPLTLLTAVLFLTGVQLLAVGLLGEILVRIYFELQHKRIYAVRKVRRFTDRQEPSAESGRDARA